MPYFPAQISKPIDYQDFERKCTVLFQCILGDPGVDRHGRSGQAQHGVDIHGLILGQRNGDRNKIVGIQCKLKGHDKKLTKEEVREEVKKALQFKPVLSEYYIVTTAPKDAELDQIALELSESKSDNHLGGMRVCVWGWQTLEEKIQQYPEAMKAFDLSSTPLSDQLAEKLDEISKKQDEILLSGQSSLHSFDPIIDDSVINNEHESQVNEYANLAREKPSVALKLLQSLLGRLSTTASKHTRFKILLNIAGCQLNLGNQEVAAQGFIEAFALDPTHPKAAANKARAFLIKKDWDNLRLFAEANLPSNPNNAQLAAYYIHSLIGDEAVSDPLELVPNTVRNTEEVMIAKVHWLMERGEDRDWWILATSAHERYPHNDELSELYAGALLEQVIKQSILVYGRELSRSDRSNVQKAMKIYTSLWTKICNSNPVREEQVSLAINLVIAYRIYDQADEALRIGNQALTIFPDSEELKICVAAVFVEQRKFGNALDLISKIQNHPERIKMRFEIALVNNDWKTIDDLVSNELDSFPKGRHTFPAAIGVLAQVQLAPDDKRYSILQEHQHDFQGDACALIPLAQYCRIHGFGDLAENYFRAAVVAVESGSDRLDSRISVAQEAMDRKQHQTVVDMLYGFVPVDRKSQALVLLSQALIGLYPIRQRAIEFFERLPCHIRELHEFQRMEGILCLSSGNLQNAIDLFSRAFQSKKCVENLTFLIESYLRAGDSDAVKLLISDSNIETLQGSSIDRLRLCDLLIHVGENERAIDLAYKALIEDIDSPDVVGKYLKIVVEFPRNFSVSIHDKVATGLWVRFTSENNISHEVIVGECEDRLWGARGDLSNAFISQALGKKVNDQFQYTNAFNTAETWTISEIKPPWLQAYSYLSKILSERYPEVQDIAFFHIDDNIQAIWDMVHRRSQSIDNRVSRYQRGELSLSLSGLGMVGGPVAIADHIVSTGKNIYVCNGLVSEYSDVHLLINNNNDSGAVIDAFTAWRAAELGVLAVLRKCLGGLFIPASEIAILQSMVQNRNPLSPDETISLHYHEGEYYRQIVTPEEKNDDLNKMKGLIANIEKECRIETVVIPDNLPDVAEQIINSHAGDAFICAILAREHNLLLLCDDLIMRKLAESLLDVKGIWIQPILFNAMENETINCDEYCDALVELACRGHFPFPMRAVDIFSVFERDESPDFTQLKILCRAFGSITGDRDSHIEVAVDFINRIWADNRFRGKQLTKPTDIVLKELLLNGNDNRGHWDTPIYLKLNSAPQGYFVQWCKKHPYY